MVTVLVVVITQHSTTFDNLNVSACPTEQVYGTLSRGSMRYQSLLSGLVAVSSSHPAKPNALKYIMGCTLKAVFGNKLDTR